MAIRRFIYLSISLLISDGAFASAPVEKDLYFSEGLYYAYQENYFDAISRLDAELGQYYGLDEPELNTLHLFINQAEFSIGDFELYYRMHKRAGRAIKSVIEADVEPVVKNEAIYRLAKIFHQKQQPENALETIEKIKGKVPENIKYDIELLKAQIYIANKHFPKAIEVLEDIEDVSVVTGFAGYNLGIAYIGNDEKEKGIVQLDKVGQIISNDRLVLAIKDKANLVLGYKLMQNNLPGRAVQYFQRIRLDGPFSNKALLGLGWANIAAKNYQRALVPWTLLSKREVTDPSVQEVLSGLPFAYGKLEAYGRAAVLYGNALEIYSRELESLDKSISSIREGHFLKAIVREEFKKDKNWLINLRELPDTPETHYLMSLLASNDFQESIKNYFDLVQLGKKIASWDGYLDAFTEIIQYRKKYYTPLFPKIQDQFRSLDSRMKLRVAQQQKVASRLDHMLIAPRPDYLATAAERVTIEDISLLEKKLSKQKKLTDDIQKRLDRLRGILNWNIEIEYQQRFIKAHENFKQLEDGFKKLNEVYRSFVRTRQAATQSYIGYDSTIRQLRIRIKQADEQIRLLLARQGYMLERMAVLNLQEQRKRIEELQIKARFALAESYDRAVKAQQAEEVEKIKQSEEQQESQQGSNNQEDETNKQNTSEPAAVTPDVPADTEKQEAKP